MVKDMCLHQDLEFGGTSCRLGKEWWGKLKSNLPWVFESIKNIKLWWGLIFRGVEFEVSIQRACNLHKERLRVLSHLWQTKDNRFYTWEEAKTKFNTGEGEQCIWERIVENILVVLTRERKMAWSLSKIYRKPTGGILETSNFLWI
jgi:hypothetical protein